MASVSLGSDPEPPSTSLAWSTQRYLQSLCEATGPRTVLDLGSGCSPTVLCPSSHSAQT